VALNPDRPPAALRRAAARLVERLPG
jgi:hypothetical protein